MHVTFEPTEIVTDSFQHCCNHIVFNSKYSEIREFVILMVNLHAVGNIST